MSRRGRIGRILISDMMLQLLAGPFSRWARRPDRGHSDDAPESDDPSRRRAAACSGFMWTVSPGVQAEQHTCATLGLSVASLLAGPRGAPLFAQGFAPFTRSDVGIQPQLRKPAAPGAL